MEYQTIPNYRQFKVKFVSPTNHRGARVKIYEPKRYRDYKSTSVTLSYDYEIGDVLQQAINWLIDNGFPKIVARCSEFENYTLLVDSWGEEFKPLTNTNQ
tara:strand:+ start:250 stop:549 length:300 start_codon:yes stop_codon:yes gene_type:complete